MKINDLEKSVIENMLIDQELLPVRLVPNFDLWSVSNRELTGVGFLTEFQLSRDLMQFLQEKLRAYAIALTRCAAVSHGDPDLSCAAIYWHGVVCGRLCLQLSG